MNGFVCVWLKWKPFRHFCVPMNLERTHNFCTNQVILEKNAELARVSCDFAARKFCTLLFFPSIDDKFNVCWGALASGQRILKRDWLVASTTVVKLKWTFSSLPSSVSKNALCREQWIWSSNQCGLIENFNLKLKSQCCLEKKCRTIGTEPNKSLYFFICSMSHGLSDGYALRFACGKNAFVNEFELGNYIVVVPLVAFSPFSFTKNQNLFLFN